MLRCSPNQKRRKDHVSLRPIPPPLSAHPEEGADRLEGGIRESSPHRGAGQDLAKSLGGDNRTHHGDGLLQGGVAPGEAVASGLLPILVEGEVHPRVEV